MILREGESLVDIAQDLIALPDIWPDPSEIESAEHIPRGSEWRYEPDWDGLGAIVQVRAGAALLISEHRRSLGRFFPEVAWALSGLTEDLTAHGELVVMRPDGFSFDLLRRRIHPSSARVAEVSVAWPATLVLTDLWAEADVDLRLRRVADRRAELTELAARQAVPVAPTNLRRLVPGAPIVVTPQTLDLDVATRWLEDADAVGRHGVWARHVEGRRVVRVGRRCTAACVVTGFQPTASGPRMLRLALYDDDELVEVGRTAALRRGPSREAAAILGAVAPQGGAEHVGEWVDVSPSLVCEVAYEYLRGRRFRHAVTLVRWLPDLDPRRCTLAQIGIRGDALAGADGLG
jgi:ATP-dependent DNA ligase